MKKSLFPVLFFLGLALAVGFAFGLEYSGLSATSVENGTTSLPTKIDLSVDNYKGGLVLQLNGQEWTFGRYSRDGSVWSSMACVPAYQGLEINDRWSENRWWIELRDSKHHITKVAMEEIVPQLPRQLPGSNSR